ncbi:23S rRNA (pseudouridine(1915)-N(3))-methyltransferase RlmH [Sinimarinibacterium sp. CAU 1509]|uniref:23S rRNA (pseudouridine(1915)-N(3))-methyltransferase RlmH n=1 Tax=Sinimarinibacterium sp. CAU 1509 TaxID=2562283 RepID=UPI0010AD7EBC|nr:23S rRNA (pseudouridine(1915)-N(3))-methyltransferase RlmH [Sinimarinibacterium sp. CAU 1509]TJY65105.1 23S rRNA (pseudouridine(1915)-N(3))-methyltransferase RlmH [Sinimarinibacterium sp. CAU 1509]
MKIHLIAVGTRMPAWVETGYKEYAGRLPHECRLELIEIAPAQRGKNTDIARAKQQEGEKILKALPRDSFVIALDEHGQQLDSTQWAGELQNWMQSGRDTCLLIGGPDGHSAEVLQRADRKWALSKLTLPHALVRVFVAEQLFRAWSLLANHPYHRA